MKIRVLLLAAGVIAAACVATGAEEPKRLKFATTSPCRPVATRYTGRQVLSWTQATVDGKQYRVSPIVEAAPGGELSHHRLTVRYTGSGTVQACIAAAGSARLASVLGNRQRCCRLGTMSKGRPKTFVPGYKGQRFAWVLVRTERGARIIDVRHEAIRCDQTRYGHIGRTFDFEEGKLPYRLMYPSNYNPRRKYPLVLSVGGSGGIGSDNDRNMEFVILGRRLFTSYYKDPELACFSLVPQIPLSRSIPKGYHPNGEKGAPDRYHPDWPDVNENGWYTQATLALIEQLKQAEGLSIDPDRIYYSGFSYGGKGCWEFLKAGRETFAAAACGGGWPIGRAYSDPRGEDLARLKMEVQRYKHIPVYVFAGSKDPMRFGSAAVHRALVAAGGKGVYDELPDTTHSQSAAKGWMNRKRLVWLFRQRRSRNPKPGPDPYPKGVYREADPPSE